MNEEDCSYITKKNLERYFSNNIFAGFERNEDHRTDFFSVYGELFEKIDKEEETEGEIDPKDCAPMPKFGDEHSSKEEVYKFYKVWGSFSTTKQFTYVDVYDPRDAPNRRIKRFIENDNKKERVKERNKFNEKF